MRRQAVAALAELSADAKEAADEKMGTGSGRPAPVPFFRTMPDGPLPP